jgi:hypothetical protein
MQATFPTLPTLPDSITLIIFHKYKFRGSPLRIFLCLPVTAFLLGPNILLRTLLSTTIRVLPFLPLICQTAD